jgi:predicted PurR-regulated permease PerM
VTTVLLALFGAMIVGETVRPAVNWLSKRMPMPVATGLVFAIPFAVLAGLVILPLRPVIRQIIALIADLPRIAAQLAGMFVNLQQLNSALRPLAATIAQDPLGIMPAFSTLVLALTMALFWLGASTPLTAYSLSLLPPEQRDAAASIFREIGGKLGAYAGGALVNVAIVAIVGMAGLALLHVPNPVILGLFQGAMIAIPYLGTFIAVMAALVVVGGAQGWIAGAEAGALIAIVHTLEGSFISPLIFKKHVDVDPLGCVVAITAGGVLFGITGVVLAVPAASVIKTLMVRVVAPAIQRRFVAGFAAAVVASSMCGIARADEVALTGDQILARAARAKGISGYNVPIHFNVHLLRPIGARGGVEGVANFTAPAKASLTITHAPPPIGTFFRGTYDLDMVPQTWAAKYHATAVALTVEGGVNVYVLQAQNVPVAATIDGVVFKIRKSDFAPLSVEWLYHDHSSIQLSFVDQKVGNLLVPLTATVSVVMPGYALAADAQYGTYTFAPNP